MINLLPFSQKKEIKQEENWKIIMTLGISILAILVCFILILYSINIFICGDVELEKILYEQREKEFEVSKMQALKTDIFDFNQAVLRLDNFYQNQFKSTKILEEILKTIPQGIYLTNLSISVGADKDKKIECKLTGFSPTRENLLSFKENLEKEGIFEHVSFPSASWVKAADINFTVNFEIKWQ